MIRTHFAVFAGLIAATSAAFASFATAMSEVGAAVLAFIEIAFPPGPARFDLVPVATAPRVTGLHQTRAFHGRLAERSDGRHRAPLSSAFAAAA